MISFIGILGGLCFAYCGVPLAYKTIKAGCSLGAPVSTAWMISIGGILMYTYLTILHGFNIILTINYSIEVISWLIIVYYHYRRKV